MILLRRASATLERHGSGILRLVSCGANPHHFLRSNSCTKSRFSTTSSDDSNLERDRLFSEYLAPDKRDAYCNVPDNIANRVGTQLHRQPNHPLNILQTQIQRYWTQTTAEKQEAPFVCLDDLSPIVTTQQCFDGLRIPPDHVSRQPSDTYYLNKDTVLRTHTSAHQVELLKQGLDRFLVSGDVYRRDAVDRSHYPVFHQMEGVQLFDQELEGLSDQAQVDFIERDLKQGLEGLATHLFGVDTTQMRWVDAYFPFTHPSFELEVYYGEEWLEVLGCGVIHPDILHTSGIAANKRGWAFGLGLERWAMVLFDISDIRLFWTRDERFLSQFRAGQVTPFQPYSKYPPCHKDISFWLPPSAFHVNDLNELVRRVAGDWVEEVVLLDQFTHPKTQRESHCYRVSYRSMDKSLTNAEIDALQDQVRSLAERELGVELR